MLFKMRHSSIGMIPLITLFSSLFRDSRVGAAAYRVLDGFTIACLRDKIGPRAKQDDVLWQTEIGR
jgi:hypothetical protein